jgi:MFS family permease
MDDGRRLPQEVRVLTAASFAVAVGFGVVAPAIPLFALSFGVGQVAVGAMLSVFALMRLVSAPWVVTVSRRLAEPATIGLGLALVAVTSTAAGLAQNYWQLLLLRGAGGLGSAMYTVCALQLVLRVTHAQQRGRAVGFFQSGFVLGTICGPALGGAVLSVSMRAPFFVYGAVVASVAVTVWARLRRATSRSLPPEGELTTGAGAVDEATPLAPAPRALGDRSTYLIALCASFAFGWTSIGIRLAIIPLFVVQSMNRSGPLVGIGLMLVAVGTGTTLVPAGRLSDNVGRRPVLSMGACTTAAALLLPVFSSATAPYLASMLVLGVGSALMSVPPPAMVGDLPGRGRPQRIARQQMAGDLGAITGPLVAGWAVQRWSFSAAFVVTVVMLLGIAVAAAPRAASASRQPVSA